MIIILGAAMILGILSLLFGLLAINKEHKIQKREAEADARRDLSRLRDSIRSAQLKAKQTKQRKKGHVDKVDKKAFDELKRNQAKAEVQPKPDSYESKYFGSKD